jgi:DNA repair protein RecO (recombination protein O)
MAVITTECVILQAFRYGDTSKIVRLLTASHGLRSAIAKGASRPRSKFGAVLEPFATGTATLYLRDGRELQTLTAFELARGHHRLGSDLLRFGGASLIAELVLRTGNEEPQPQLFEQVQNTFVRIQDCEATNLESVILAGAWSLVTLLGFAPELDTCLDCGRLIEAAEEVRFDPAAGSVRCTRCSAGARGSGRAASGRLRSAAESQPRRAGTSGKRLPSHARSALSRLASGESVKLERTSGHWRLLTLFLDHHVLEGAPLKSLAFLAEALDARPCAS